MEQLFSGKMLGHFFLAGSLIPELTTSESRSFQFLNINLIVKFAL